MKRNLILVTALLVTVLILVLFFWCKKPCREKRIAISYHLPEDLPAGASEKELAEFAWKEFFALNWESSWAKDSNRTTPDKTWNFEKSGAQPNLAVWETFIHRSELRPANGIRMKDLSSGKPSYSFVDDSTIINQGSQGHPKIDLSSYWDVLDEDNEIGSSYLFAHQNQNEVLYMAKTNLTEYNYLKNYYPTDSLLYAAGNKIYKNYDTATEVNTKNLNYFKSLTKAQMCDSGGTLTSKGYICLPCVGDEDSANGVTEIKLAFRKLDPSKDSINRFITKDVVVFLQDSPTKPIYAKVEVYGLIGMHIIHKSKNYPAFIFASFEQADVRNANMQTFALPGDGGLVDTIKQINIDPHRLNPVIERVIPEGIQKVNQMIRDCIIALNPDSKWQYYQLIGVEANPIDYRNRNSDNNYFMANYVIESDLKLTNFHGSFGDPFNNSIQNVVSNGQSYNMGGCMGCHGQAQVTFGTNFSFLLDSGHDKPVITPDLLQTYKNVLDSSKSPPP
jgi:hypothetical protein